MITRAAQRATEADNRSEHLESNYLGFQKCLLSNCTMSCNSLISRGIYITIGLIVLNRTYDKSIQSLDKK